MNRSVKRSQHKSDRNPSLPGRPARLALLVCVLFTLSFTSHCLSRDIASETHLVRENIPELGVNLAIPENWVIEAGDFFQLTAEGYIDDNLVVIDYRSLEKERKDDESMRQYARGWYAAIQLSYQNWTYVEQTEIDDDPEGAFYFEGVYEKDEVTYQKMGVLRFRDNRVHTIYYTAPEDEFDMVRPLFLKIDGMHRYFPPEAMEDDESTESDADALNQADGTE